MTTLLSIRPPSDVTLREVTAENVNSILALAVRDTQTSLVATNAKSIAQAHFSREAWFRAIYLDETPVGFAMLYDPYLTSDAPKSEYYELWRFMIAGDYQGMGIGRRAMKLIVAHVRTRPNAKTLLLTHVQEPGNAGPFYLKMGFEYTGNDQANGELEMRLVLST